MVSAMPMLPMSGWIAALALAFLLASLALVAPAIIRAFVWAVVVEIGWMWERWRWRRSWRQLLAAQEREVAQEQAQRRAFEQAWTGEFKGDPRWRR